MSTVTAIKERPILFNGEMVRAILDGRKTQTRRIINNDRMNECVNYPIVGTLHTARNGEHLFGVGSPDESVFVKSPFGAPGDRLWVRETWAPRCYFDPEEMGYDYAADFNKKVDWKWHPSIHMPREASRITLEITDVRIERLREISESDALAEGTAEVFPDPASSHMNIYRPVVGEQPLTGTLGNATECFAQAWIEIYGMASWQETPWVWVYEFRMIKPASVEASAGDGGQ